MLKNYLKIAVRSLFKYRAYSLINVTGLAVGVSACMLILLYVQNELSYDRYHLKADQIYRLITKVQTESETNEQANSSAAMGPALRDEFPEVIDVVRFMPAEMLVRYGSHQYQEENAFYADSSVFAVFSYALIEGDPRTALKEPLSIVLTEKAARKYFGAARALGQTLIIDNQSAFKVTGILAEVPRHSHFTFDMLISFSTGERLYPHRMGWFSFAHYTYLLLPKNFKTSVLEAKFPDFLDRHIGQQLQQYGMNYVLSLQPLRQIYLRSNRIAEIGTVGSMSRLHIFSVIALFVLLIACVNFMNLVTARSAKRAKEVGVRKAIGAQRAQLVRQFLGEAILLSFISLLFALGLCEALLPAFNALSGKELSLHPAQNPSFVILLLGLALFVGLLAGSYPALLLSRFQPVVVLKGTFGFTKLGVRLRRGLVVFQFAISVVLIIGAIVVYSQLEFLRKQNLGFSEELMLVMDFYGDENVKQKLETIKRELLAHPGVVNGSYSSAVPGTGMTTWHTVVELEQGKTRESNLQALLVDYDFFKNYGIELLAGRPFSKEFVTDEQEAFIINEAAVAHLGWASPEMAIGRMIRQIGARKQGRIIGVVKDFHYESLHHQVAPLSIHIIPARFSYLSLRLKTADMARTTAMLKQSWERLIPDRPFEYFFLDENFDRQYRAEEQFGRVFGVFAVLAILIASLGLYGLASFTAEQRFKEIGIRKVLGASAVGIVGLLSKEYCTLVALANIIAWPIAYYSMRKWLQDFAYRLDLSWWLFVLAGGLALAIALISVSTQALKAAFANPVEALRYE
ncbi:MAG: ABC transporter permease [bacterium]